jgi:hypothetical protein
MPRDYLVSCFGQRDELRGDRLFDAVVAVSSPQTDADHSAMQNHNGRGGEG